MKKNSGVYMEFPGREERVDPSEDAEEDTDVDIETPARRERQTTQVTRLHEKLNERLEKSKRRLTDVGNKVDELHRVARRKQSVDKMRAVVSDTKE